MLTDYEAEVVQKTILDLVEQNKLRLYAYVVMPNHLHVLLKPIKGRDFKNYTANQGGEPQDK